MAGTVVDMRLAGGTLVFFTEAGGGVGVAFFGSTFGYHTHRRQ
jgi:hypothetical protein